MGSGFGIRDTAGSQASSSTWREFAQCCCLVEGVRKIGVSIIYIYVLYVPM